MAIIKKIIKGGKIEKGIILVSIFGLFLFFFCFFVSNNNAYAEVCLGNCANANETSTFTSQGKKCFSNPVDTQEIINGCGKDQYCCVDAGAKYFSAPDSTQAMNGFCFDSSNCQCTATYTGTCSSGTFYGVNSCNDISAYTDCSGANLGGNNAADANLGGIPEATANLGGTPVVPIPIPNVGLPDPPGGIKTVLENLLRWMLGIVGVVAIIGFVVSGIQYIVSTGNETVMESAKRNMLFSIIGIIVVLSSFVIIQAIDYALNARSLF